MSFFENRRPESHATNKISTMPVLMINDFYISKNTTPNKSPNPNNMNNTNTNNNRRNSTIFNYSNKTKSPAILMQDKRRSVSSAITTSSSKMKSSSHYLNTPANKPLLSHNGYSGLSNRENPNVNSKLEESNNANYPLKLDFNVKDEFMIKVEDSGTKDKQVQTPLKENNTNNELVKTFSINKDSLQARRMNRKSGKFEDLSDLNIKIESLETERNKIQEKIISNVVDPSASKSKIQHHQQQQPQHAIDVTTMTTTTTMTAPVTTPPTTISSNSSQIPPKSSVTQNKLMINRGYYHQKDSKTRLSPKKTFEIDDTKKSKFEAFHQKGTIDEPLLLDEISDISPISKNPPILSCNSPNSMLNKAKMDITFADGRAMDTTLDFKNDTMISQLEVEGVGGVGVGVGGGERLNNRLFNSSLFGDEDIMSSKNLIELLDAQKKTCNAENKDDSNNKVIIHGDNTKKVRASNELRVINLEDDESNNRNNNHNTHSNNHCLDEEESLLHMIDLENRFLPIENLNTMTTIGQSSTNATTNVNNSNKYHNANNNLSTKSLQHQTKQNTIIIDCEAQKNEKKQSIKQDSNNTKPYNANNNSHLNLENINSENDCINAINKILDVYYEKNCQNIRKTFFSTATIKDHLTKRIKDLIDKKFNENIEHSNANFTKSSNSMTNMMIVANNEQNSNVSNNNTNQILSATNAPMEKNYDMANDNELYELRAKRRKFDEFRKNQEQFMNSIKADSYEVALETLEKPQNNKSEYSDETDLNGLKKLKRN